MRSRPEPIKRVTRSPQEHRESILNWFRARKQFNGGIVGGLNGLAKLCFRKAFGCRAFDAMQVKSYPGLGDLPGLFLTHRFC